MNIISLKEKLKQSNVRLDRFNIYGDGPSEGLTIIKRKSTILGISDQGPKVKRYVDTDIHWEVYFSERGQKFDLKKHFDEASAYQDFFLRANQLIKQDPDYYSSQ